MLQFTSFRPYPRVPLDYENYQMAPQQFGAQYVEIYNNSRSVLDTSNSIALFASVIEDLKLVDFRFICFLDYEFSWVETMRLHSGVHSKDYLLFEEDRLGNVTHCFTGENTFSFGLTEGRLVLYDADEDVIVDSLAYSLAGVKQPHGVHRVPVLNESGRYKKVTRTLKDPLGTPDWEELFNRVNPL